MIQSYKKKQPPFISVVICTYNRALLLKSALESLRKQTLDKSIFEIIIIDNNSSDNTKAIVKKFLNNNKSIKLSYFFEKKQGLAVARNTGVRISKGKYIAFLDDDSRADQSYLKIAAQILKKIKPRPDGVGGIIKPLYINKKPDWFNSDFETIKIGESQHFLREGESFSGSNMILHKKLIRSQGGFDIRVGMKGVTVSAGEETSLFDNFWKDINNKKQLYYSPELVVYHSIPLYKMTVKYQLARSYAFGQAWYLRHRSSNKIERVFQNFRCLGYIIINIFLTIMNIIKYKNPKTWIVDRGKYVTFGLGYLFKSLNISFTVKRQI
jgi:glucosyl-dolichyl phosphate glucuronosyltransferase